MADRIVKLTLGYPPHTREVEITLPDDEPTPWDLNSKLSVMGKRHPKVDAVAKVTGAARYTHDMNLPGMLYGGFVRSRYARAEIVSVDAAAAIAHPEVKASMSMAGAQARYAGQPLFALAAETRQGLEEAIALVKVTYKPLPHAARLDMALADGAPLVHQNRESNMAMGAVRNLEATEQALKDSAAVVEATCTTQVQNHCSLESHGTVAHFEGDKLTVWTSTQATFGVRQQIAQHFRNRDTVDASAITVISEFMGGGFGSKFPAGYWSIAAAELALSSGRPVKIMLDRREEMTDTGNRPDSHQEMKLGVNADGTIKAYHVKKYGTPGVSQGAGITNPMIYRFGTQAVQSGEVATNAGSQQAFRAPGHPQGSFAMELILDMAADAIGMDPIAFRLQNDEHPTRRLQYAEGARRIGWDQRKPTGSATGRFRVGYGVGAARWGGMGGPRAEALCKIHPDGSVEIRNGAQDIGVGTRTLLAIVTAEELGLSPAQITTAIGNTNDPIGPGSGGSTTAASIAPAVRQAAFLVGRELRALVATHLSVTADDLVFRDGFVAHVKDNTKRIAFKEACRLIRQGPLSAMGKRASNYGRGNTAGGIWNTEVGGAQFAKVTVDVDFGTVRVDRIVALQDCGKVINTNTAEGQVYGGVIQGISYALFEERHMDRHQGFMVNADMEAYKIAGPVDMPEIEVVLFDVANGGNNCSVAGIGEPTMVPTAAAIGCAVRNALGVAVTSLPLTPNHVLNALTREGK
jgi:xanthine dehydrogenase YagR molybdenum-binding subunit